MTESVAYPLVDSALEKELSRPSLKAQRRPILPQGWTASLHSGSLAHRKLNSLERSFEERRGDEQRADAEREQKKQVPFDGDKASILQQNGFESVNRVREWIHNGNGAQPLWKRGDRVNGARREEQQRVEHAEHRARHKGIVDAHHHQKHHAVEGDRRSEDEQEQVE